MIHNEPKDSYKFRFNLLKWYAVALITYLIIILAGIIVTVITGLNWVNDVVDYITVVFHLLTLAFLAYNWREYSRHSKANEKRQEELTRELGFNYAYDFDYPKSRRQISLLNLVAVICNVGSLIWVLTRIF